MLETLLQDGIQVIVAKPFLISNEKNSLLKTFIETRWCHRFRSKEALKRYQDRQLARTNRGYKDPQAMAFQGSNALLCLSRL